VHCAGPRAFECVRACVRGCFLSLRAHGAFVYKVYSDSVPSSSSSSPLDLSASLSRCMGARVSCSGGRRGRTHRAAIVEALQRVGVKQEALEDLLGEDGRIVVAFHLVQALQHLDGHQSLGTWSVAHVVRSLVRRNELIQLPASVCTRAARCQLQHGVVHTFQTCAAPTLQSWPRSPTSPPTAWPTRAAAP